jgi:hypothetical protein
VFRQRVFDGDAVDPVLVQADQALDDVAPRHLRQVGDPQPQAFAVKPFHRDGRRDGVGRGNEAPRPKRREQRAISHDDGGERPRRVGQRVGEDELARARRLVLAPLQPTPIHKRHEKHGETNRERKRHHRRHLLQDNGRQPFAGIVRVHVREEPVEVPYRGLVRLVFTRVMPGTVVRVVVAAEQVVLMLRHPGKLHHNRREVYNVVLFSFTSSHAHTPSSSHTDRTRRVRILLAPPQVLCFR